MKEQEFIFENQILTSVARGYDSPKKLTGFMARKGQLYNHEIMVVGRAVNGWISEADARLANEFVDAEKRTHFRIASQSLDGDSICSMQWVLQNWININSQEYSTNRSAFWRVIKSLVLQLNIDGLNESNWSSHLVWSNLYKISPYVGRNPSDKLCWIQLEGCISLFQQELAEYMPKRLLLLTGENWAKDFLPDICNDKKTVGNYVEACGYLSNNQKTKVVVACHPERKKEGIWIQEVYSAFETND